jgi:hypothetical protein
MAKAPAKKKEYKLDLFGQTLPALNRGDLDFYDRCTEEERKEIQPLILMRWISGVENSRLGGAYIGVMNEWVNKEFWTLSKHPELQWKLMCVGNIACGGRGQRHQWVPMIKNSSTNKLDSLILSLNPGLNDQELALVRTRLTKDSLKQLLRDMAMSDADMKPILDEFKKLVPHG